MSRNARTRRSGFTLVELPAVSGRKRAAFTLVELLVVIGIIALLISMLLPALNKARQQAQTVACLSNLRTLGQLTAIYQAENRTHFPPMSQWATATGFTGSGFRGLNLWALLKIKAGSTTAVCPTALQMDKPVWTAANDNRRALFSYRYNFSLSGCETNGNIAPEMPHPRARPGGGWDPNPSKSIKNSSEVLTFIDYPQLVAWTPDETNGPDRGMSHARLTSYPGGTEIVDGSRRQVMQNIAPVHGQLTPSKYLPALSDGSVPMKGIANVLCADGSAKSVIVTQGQFLNQASPVHQVVLTDATTAGNVRAGNRCVVEGVRYNPFKTP
jgi:prepilin-type N-terminal cleavage/methylation domain-containing protein